MKKIVPYAFAILLLFLFLFLTACGMRIIGFRYPHVIEDEPLKNPVKVIGVVSNRLMLADNRMLEVDLGPGQDITNQLSQSGYMIDFENESDIVAIYARQDGWICGTPWASLIRIPIFKITVYKNRRQLITFGKFIKEK